MKILGLIFSVILFKQNIFANSDITSISTLTSNFFLNLNRADFGQNLTEETRYLIDNQIDHYVNLIQRIYGFNGNTKNKRSIYNNDDNFNVLSMDFIGVHVLTGFFAHTRMPVKNPIDIVLFKREIGNDGVWYAATLQAKNKDKKTADFFILYRFEEETYVQIHSLDIKNGLKIEAYDLDGIGYIILAEEKSTYVYKLDFNEYLLRIQTIDGCNPTSIAVWRMKNGINSEIYMSISQNVETIHSISNYETPNTIFKWDGQLFIVFQNIETSSAQKITPFTIGDSNFLAVANYRNNKGDTDIFSYVYKFEQQHQKYVLYQQILTHAAVDVQFFCFQQNNMEEVFLIFANSFEKNSQEEKTKEANSILYKFVEDYFMPFQSFKLISPVKWLPVAGENGEFILLISCKDSGIKIYQFDGWWFLESEVQYTDDAFQSGIISMQSYSYNKQQLIVVANEHDQGNMVNVFYPTFSYQNIMHDFQKGMQEWCQKTTKELDFIDLEELVKFVEDAPKIDDDEIKLNSRIYFQNVSIHNLVLDEKNIQTTNRRVKKSIDISYLEERIDKKSEELQYLDAKLRDNNEPIILQGDVKVKELVVDSDRIVFQDLQTKQINDVQIQEFLNDVYTIDQPFDLYDNILFEQLIFDGLTVPKFVNNVPKQRLVFRRTDTSDLNLVVDGNIVVDELEATGYIDDVLVNDKNVFLTEGVQHLYKGALRMTNLTSQNMFVSYINSIDLPNLEKDRYVDVSEHTIESIKSTNIKVGYINGYNMRDLENLVLRNTGDQKLIGSYEFDTLVVDELEIDGLLSGTKIEDIAKVNEKSVDIPQSLIFTQDLNVKHLHVTARLDHIPVYNSKLDVLLKNHSELQFISGTKTFSTLNLIGPINLRGQIKTKGLEPPIITKDLVLKGDYTITGETIIANSLKFNNLLEPSGNYSMDRLQNQGLKLNEKEIPVFLDFVKGLYVDGINVDTINEINPKSWIIFGEDEIPYISGTKRFNHGLDLDGDVHISSINGYNLEKLYDNILKKTGNQTITGNHRYSIVKVNRAAGNKIFINNKPWKDVMTLNSDQVINGTTTILNPVKMKHLEIDSAQFNGLLLNHNFDELIEDTLFNSSTKAVTGKNFFKQMLKFEHVNIDRINNVDLQNVADQVNEWLGDIHISGLMEIFAPLSVENLTFNGDVNGLDSKDFGKIWLLKRGKQSIDQQQFFDSTSFSKLDIESNEINGIDLKELDFNAVKINENYHFDSAKFLSGISSNDAVNVKGNIRDFNTDDIILSKGVKNQTLSGSKILLNNLTIDGQLRVKGLLTGINLTLLNQLIDPHPLDKNMNLIIDGNINFYNEFNVNNFNGHKIKDLSATSWYTNRETKVQGFVSFDTVIFEDDLTVDGYVDDIELHWLSKNYFSKTKDQNITATLDFIGGVVFEKNLDAKKGLISGLIGDLNLMNFYDNILRHDEQVFNVPLKFDSLVVAHKFATNLINNLNLQTDVVRSDAIENYITGTKTVRNVNAIDLKMPAGKKIQNIDIDYWFQNAVTTTGSFIIDGLKTLKNAKFEHNIKLPGLLNGIKFDENHIVTTHTKQKITGRKNFITSDYLINSTLEFDILRVKGLFNNIQMDKLIESQLDSSKDVIQISAVKRFYKTISAENVQIRKSFQGVNIPELLKNITDLSKINNHEKEYQRLINFSTTVLERQPFYLNYFKLVSVLDQRILNAIRIEGNEAHSMALLTVKKNVVTASIYYFENNGFINQKNYEIKTKNPITFMSPVQFENKWKLYLEEQNDEIEGSIHDILETSDNNMFITTSGAEAISSFQLPNSAKNCLVSLESSHIQIHCQQPNILELAQVLDIENGFKISTIKIKNIPYLIVASRAPNVLHTKLHVLKFDETHNEFKIDHTLYELNIYCIDTISYKENYYLVVGVRVIYVEEPAVVIIYKYNEKQEKFAPIQSIQTKDPIEVKFHILSTNDLILFVANDCPIESFVMYKYDGIVGFKFDSIIANTNIVTNINPLIIDGTDFVAVYNNTQFRIFKAMYIGRKYN